jgi:hypothetical protein
MAWIPTVEAMRELEMEYGVHKSRHGKKITE